MDYQITGFTWNDKTGIPAVMVSDGTRALSYDAVNDELRMLDKDSHLDPAEAKTIRDELFNKPDLFTGVFKVMKTPPLVKVDFDLDATGKMKDAGKLYMADPKGHIAEMRFEGYGTDKFKLEIKNGAGDFVPAPESLNKHPALQYACDKQQHRYDFDVLSVSKPDHGVVDVIAAMGADRTPVKVTYDTETGKIGNIAGIKINKGEKATDITLLDMKKQKDDSMTGYILKKLLYQGRDLNILSAGDLAERIDKGATYAIKYNQATETAAVGKIKEVLEVERQLKEKQKVDWEKHSKEKESMPFRVVDVKVRNSGSGDKSVSYDVVGVVTTGGKEIPIAGTYNPKGEVENLRSVSLQKGEKMPSDKELVKLAGDPKRTAALPNELAKGLNRKMAERFIERTAKQHEARKEKAFENHEHNRAGNTNSPGYESKIGSELRKRAEKVKGYVNDRPGILKENSRDPWLIRVVRGLVVLAFDTIATIANAITRKTQPYSDYDAGNTGAAYQPSGQENMGYGSQVYADKGQDLNEAVGKAEAAREQAQQEPKAERKPSRSEQGMAI